MKTREVIGRKIVKVNRSWAKTPGGRVMAVESLVLDNGLVLLTHAYETEDLGPFGGLLIQQRAK